MIIGLFTDSYPPVVDGVARVVLNYSKQLQARCDTCYVITPEHPDTDTAYKNNLLTFASLPAPGRSEYRFGLGLADIPFWNQIKNIPFDILHTHSPFSAHQVASALSRRNGAPLVSTFHSKYREDFCQVVKNEKIVDALVIKNIVRTYNRVDEVWAVNDASIKTLRSYGFNGYIHVMENACDLSPAEPSPEISAEIRQIFNLSDAPILMFVGQHTVQKNLPMIVSSLEKLHSMGKEFNMLFVGDGPLREELMNRVRKNGLERKIIFVGTVRDRALIQKLYLSSYALVFPSLYDSSSLVQREAAACCCPTVFVEGATTAGGIIDGVNGFLGPRTPDEFAIKLAALLDNPSLRDSVARCARKTLYRSWPDAVDEAYHRYEEIIARKKQQASTTRTSTLFSSRRTQTRARDRRFSSKHPR